MEFAIETNKCGKTHADTIDINDHANLLRQLAAMDAKGQNPRVKQIELYHDGKLVYGWEFVYELLDGREVQTGHHIAGGLHPDVRCD